MSIFYVHLNNPDYECSNEFMFTLLIAQIILISVDIGPKIHLNQLL